MSWVEVLDPMLGPVVVELQPTVLEVFQARTQATHRFHLRFLVIQHRGPDGQGNHQVEVGSNGGHTTVLTAPEPQWARLWPLLEQARAAQYPYLGY
jgi:hypothetical protein